MPESQQHRRISERIARKNKAQYNSVKGPDIVTPTRAIEVGTDPSQVSTEMKQVARYRKARYVAGDAPFVKAAVKATRGTGIGVMDSQGNIKKRARRRPR